MEEAGVNMMPRHRHAVRRRPHPLDGKHFTSRSGNVLRVTVLEAPGPDALAIRGVWLFRPSPEDLSEGEKWIQSETGPTEMTTCKSGWTGDPETRAREQEGLEQWKVRRAAEEYATKHVIMRGDLSMKTPGYKRIKASDSGKCFLCRAPLAAGADCFLVPNNCDETEKMQDGEDYKGQLAHEKCVTAVFAGDGVQ